jgi:two-component sensor histidine kinase
LKAGEYRLNIEESKVTIADGKNSIEVPVKVENGGTKFGTTVVRYTAEGGKSAISEIRIGGTRTRLIFNP